jgi:hypothetical protein
MFGCSVKLWELECFLKKKTRVYGWVVSKFEVFFENYELQFFSKSLEAHM